MVCQDLLAATSDARTLGQTLIWLKLLPTTHVVIGRDVFNRVCLSRGGRGKVQGSDRKLCPMSRVQGAGLRSKGGLGPRSDQRPRSAGGGGSRSKVETQTPPLAGGIGMVGEEWSALHCNLNGRLSCNHYHNDSKRSPAVYDTLLFVSYKDITQYNHCRIRFLLITVRVCGQVIVSVRFVCASVSVSVGMGTISVRSVFASVCLGYNF